MDLHYLEWYNLFKLLFTSMATKICRKSNMVIQFQSLQQISDPNKNMSIIISILNSHLKLRQPGQKLFKNSLFKIIIIVFKQQYIL
ncbi:unnamed protein product [Paramecium pentaurelia]|uniref:Uncharacterized protein n=1 Tax=Paramecium pentaurelia TaxID=43138 RepID=A0A8S1Y305_9CILI|nr:unnamed protein product [Paramecium pentaurelia]